MATIRRTITVCDQCETAHEVRSIIIKIGSSTRTVDLCAQHRTSVEEAHRAGRRIKRQIEPAQA